MSRIEQPSQFWLCGLLIGLLIKAVVIIAALTFPSEELMQLMFLDPGSEIQASVANWVFGSYFEPCCFGCLRADIVFGVTFIVGFALECAIAGWLLDCLFRSKWFREA